MGTLPERRFKIVVAVDDSEYSHMVLERALDEAARREPAEIHVLRVVPLPKGRLRAHVEPDLTPIKASLKAMVAQKVEDFGHGPVTTKGSWRVLLHVRAGDAVEEIAALAAETRADLLVLGRFGVNEARHRRHGTVVEKVVHEVHTPTLIVTLGEEQVAEEETCAACVETRERSEGEHWFCSDHSRGYLGTSTILMTHTDSLFGHGPMW